MKKNKWLIYAVLMVLIINALRVAFKVYNKRTQSKVVTSDSIQTRNNEF